MPENKNFLFHFYDASYSFVYVWKNCTELIPDYIKDLLDFLSALSSEEV